MSFLGSFGVFQKFSRVLQRGLSLKLVSKVGGDGKNAFGYIIGLLLTHQINYRPANVL